MTTSTAYRITPLDELPPQSNKELAASVSGLCSDVIGLEEDRTWLTGKVWQLMDEQRALRLALGDAIDRLNDAAIVVGRLEARVAELERGNGGQ